MSAQYAWYIYEHGHSDAEVKLSYSSNPVCKYTFKKCGTYRVKLFIKNNNEIKSYLSKWFDVCNNKK